MKGRYPVCCLFIEVDAAEVDVNIHPAKREVKFHREKAVRQWVAQAVRDTLLKFHAPVPGARPGAIAPSKPAQPPLSLQPLPAPAPQPQPRELPNWPVSPIPAAPPPKNSPNLRASSPAGPGLRSTRPVPSYQYPRKSARQTTDRGADQRPGGRQKNQAQTQKEVSRLEVLIQQQMVRLDTRNKRLLDSLKLIARNAFYGALRPPSRPPTTTIGIITNCFEI